MRPLDVIFLNLRKDVDRRSKHIELAVVQLNAKLGKLSKEKGVPLPNTRSGTTSLDKKKRPPFSAAISISL